MSQRISATFVDGVFKPDEAVNLPDQTCVEVIIEPVPDASSAMAAWNALKERIALRPIHAGGKRYTRDELHERR